MSRLILVLSCISSSPFSHLLDNRKCWNLTPKLTPIISSVWRLTFYLFWEKVLTIALILFLIERWTQPVHWRVRLYGLEQDVVVVHRAHVTVVRSSRQDVQTLQCWRAALHSNVRTCHLPSSAPPPDIHTQTHIKTACSVTQDMLAVPWCILRNLNFRYLQQLYSQILSQN